MKPFSYRIIPYDNTYEEQLMALERDSPQGSWISLEMIRDNFLSRSRVFDESAVFLSISSKDDVMGVMAGAITPMRCNDKELTMGITYDVRVGRLFRGNGLTKKMGKFVTERYFSPRGVAGVFLTMKASNHAVYKSAKILGMKLYRYSFVYLSIPVRTRKRLPDSVELDSQLRVDLFPTKTDLTDYTRPVSSGHTLFHNHRMYAIRIRKLHPLINLPLRFADLFLDQEQKLPKPGDIIRFSTLCSAPDTTFLPLRQTLKTLRSDGVDFLSVICKKGGATHRQLKSFAANSYPYCIVSTYPLREEDRLVLDARCL